MYKYLPLSVFGNFLILCWPSHTSTSQSTCSNDHKKPLERYLIFSLIHFAFYSAHLGMAWVFLIILNKSILLTYWHNQEVRISSDFESTLACCNVFLFLHFEFADRIFSNIFHMDSRFAHGILPVLFNLFTFSCGDCIFLFLKRCQALVNMWFCYNISNHL